MYGMDKKFVSEADRHESTIIAIAARAHYEAERVEIPVAIQVPHHSQASSIFSCMQLIEQRLSAIEERLKYLEICEKYNVKSQEILYVIANNTTIGNEKSRTHDFRTSAINN